MLSEKIRDFAAHFAEFRHTGMNAAPETVKSFVQVLGAMEADARALELSVVGTGARRQLRDEDNVIEIARFLHRRGCRMGMAANGGDAA